MFVDIGKSKSTVTIAEFTKTTNSLEESKESGENAYLQANIITSKTDINLGGRDLDWKILEDFCQELLEEHEIDLNKLKTSVLYRMLK